MREREREMLPVISRKHLRKNQNDTQIIHKSIDLLWFSPSQSVPKGHLIFYPTHYCCYKWSLNNKKKKKKRFPSFSDTIKMRCEKMGSIRKWRGSWSSIDHVLQTHVRPHSLSQVSCFQLNRFNISPWAPVWDFSFLRKKKSYFQWKHIYIYILK